MLNCQDNSPQTTLVFQTIVCKESRIHFAALTCYRETGRLAGNGPQVVDSGDALIGSLIRLIVLGVDDVGEEQRAIGKYVSSLV